MRVYLVASFRVMEVHPPEDESETHRDKSNNEERVNVVVDISPDPVRERPVCGERVRVRFDRVAVPDGGRRYDSDYGREHSRDAQEEVLPHVVSFVGDERQAHKEHATDEDRADGREVVGAEVKPWRNPSVRHLGS